MTAGESDGPVQECCVSSNAAESFCTKCLLRAELCFDVHQGTVARRGQTESRTQSSLHFAAARVCAQHPPLAYIPAHVGVAQKRFPVNGLCLSVVTARRQQFERFWGVCAALLWPALLYALRHSPARPS